MHRTLVVFKREFEAMVRTRSFVIGTILMPLFMIGIFAFQFFLFSRMGGGEADVAIVDETEILGASIQQQLAGLGSGFAGSKPVTFRSEVIVPSADAAAVRERLNARVAADSLDGYLWIPRDVMTGTEAEYIGSNATSTPVVEGLRDALQRSVQTVRLGREGIDPERVAAALQPVRMKATKAGEDGEQGSAELATVLAFLMGFAIYFMVAIYGAGVMNAVLEEKRDRIVEVIVSSVKAKELMAGKVFGVGAAGLLQMLLWVVTAAVLMKYGGQIATLFGMDPERARAFSGMLSTFPKVPVHVTGMFLVFFVGGFFIYSTLYAIIGAIATNNQEAQQLVFPAMLPLIASILMLQPSLMSPEAGVAVIGSLIPFTAPLIMPARAVVTNVPVWQVLISLVLLGVTVGAVIWVGAKIYRIGIFATGKKPTLKEVARWIRTA